VSGSNTDWFRRNGMIVATAASDAADSLFDWDKFCLL